ncbi:sensor histidine kinase [Sinomicrobium oceani]|uniref:sensor histidine kinase n=1 Tax=Sinomicrobium oceani TaxID=1150368 RepID=UPI002279F666|nr:ATP-binding protein [Sinomicrobium oceani]
MDKARKKTGLLQKTSRIFVMLSFLLMCCSTVVLYFYVRHILQQEIEEELYAITDRIETSLQQGEAPYSMPPVIEVVEAAATGQKILRDTLLYDDTQGKMELFRELVSFRTAGNRTYRITVRDYVLESQKILAAIIFSYVLIIALVFILLFYLNRAGNAYLWRPFFETLEKIGNFSLIDKEPLKLQDPDIREFSQLNKQVKTLTEKVRDDYRNLKQFTEDVSHELQTPLSIIQMKVDNIINSAPLSDEQYKQLTSIQKDIKRVTQMNKGLTLLTKIENNQFNLVREIDLSGMIRDKIADFEGLSNDKIELVCRDTLVVKMDYHLAEILCNNLISNAIKHCSGTGNIRVETTFLTLTVINPGDRAIVHADQVFERFYRENNSVRSTGLGLAIVKKICDLYQFDIAYAFVKNMHVFTVTVPGDPVLLSVKTPKAKL